ncbi:MAG: DUF47 family protein [Bacteroidales bacterium]|nr:DUF47 family protein [Bacteroidales bacterium]
MKIDNFLQLFVVKEKRFFPLFIQAAENIDKAADLLLEQAKSDNPDQRRMLAHRIKERETEGDTITKKIVEELMAAYVTPFDRDDIHELAESLDTFLDTIRDSSKQIAMYQPKEPSRKLIEIAEYIKQDAVLFIEITKKFDNMRKEAKEVDDLCDKIKEIEHIVDDVFESYMSNLFEFEKDAIELTKKKNIAQALEDISDKAKSTAKVIRSIAVKMS